MRFAQNRRTPSPDRSLSARSSSHCQTSRAGRRSRVQPRRGDAARNGHGYCERENLSVGGALQFPITLNGATSKLLCSPCPTGRKSRSWGGGLDYRRALRCCVDSCTPELILCAGFLTVGPTLLLQLRPFALPHLMAQRLRSPKQQMGRNKRQESAARSLSRSSGKLDRSVTQRADAGHSWHSGGTTGSQPSGTVAPPREGGSEERTEVRAGSLLAGGGPRGGRPPTKASAAASSPTLVPARSAAPRGRRSMPGQHRREVITWDES